MLDIHMLEERNIKRLKVLLDEFNIDLSIEEIIGMASIYIASETDKEKIAENPDQRTYMYMTRLRLMCSKKVMKEIDMGDHKVYEHIKTKKIQLYTINNKKIKTMQAKEIQVLLLKLKFLIEVVNELQSFEAIKQSEMQYSFYSNYFKLEED